MSLNEGDIRSGLSPKQICTKHHIPPVQDTEIKSSMQAHETQDHISESRPAITKRYRHEGNVSFLALIILVLFLLTLSYLIYHRVTGPKLGFGVFRLIIFLLGMIISFAIES